MKKKIKTRKCFPDLEEREGRKMAKLPQGTRKRSDGSYEKRFTIDGKRYSVYAPNTKELAEKEIELREIIKQGRYKKNNSVTLDNYFQEWIEHKALDTKGNSLFTYKSIYNNHIKQKLGKYKVSELERRQITELQKDLIKEYPPSTTNYVILVIKMILNDAIKDGIIRENVARIKSVKTENKRTENHRALTIEEQKLFMEESKTSVYYELFALALCSGMRFGELTALTWADIDNKENCIHVTKTMTWSAEGKQTIGTPKSSTSERNIPITPNIKKILQEQRKKNNLLSIDRSNDRIFNSTRKGTLQNATINYEIRKIVKRLNEQGHDIKPFTAHAFRDTFATRYIEQGGNMQTLKKLLGHSSITMTMDIYAQVLPNTLQDEMNKIVINI